MFQNIRQPRASFARILASVATLENGTCSIRSVDSAPGFVATAAAFADDTPAAWRAPSMRAAVSRSSAVAVRPRRVVFGCAARISLAAPSRARLLALRVSTSRPLGTRTLPRRRSCPGVSASGVARADLHQRW